MGRGFADEAVVVVKLETCEDAVTYLRIKFPASGSDAGGEGRNMLRVTEILLRSVTMRSAIKERSLRRRRTLLVSLGSKDVQTIEMVMQKKEKEK